MYQFSSRFVAAAPKHADKGQPRIPLFGVRRDPTGRLERQRPRSIDGPDGAVVELAELTGVGGVECSDAIRRWRLASYEAERRPETGLPIFAFRVHLSFLKTRLSQRSCVVRSDRRFSQPGSDGSGSFFEHSAPRLIRPIGVHPVSTAHRGEPLAVPHVRADSFVSSLDVAGVGLTHVRGTSS